MPSAAALPYIQAGQGWYHQMAAMQTTGTVNMPRLHLLPKGSLQPYAYKSRAAVRSDWLAAAYGGGWQGSIALRISKTKDPVYRVKLLTLALGYGMELAKVVEQHAAWVKEHGETLEGYTAYYGAKTLADQEHVRKIWESDTSFLNVLLRAGIMQAAGHDTKEITAWVILHRQMWVKTMNRKGMTAIGVLSDAYLAR